MSKDWDIASIFLIKTLFKVIFLTYNPQRLLIIGNEINMVVIRLSRGGSHKKPFYQVVAADRRSACQGKYLERLGFFNPVARGEAQRLSLNQDRINYWLGVGAKPSERVASLLKEAANPAVVERRKNRIATKSKAGKSSTIEQETAENSSAE